MGFPPAPLAVEVLLQVLGELPAFLFAELFERALERLGEPSLRFGTPGFAELAERRAALVVERTLESFGELTQRLGVRLGPFERLLLALERVGEPVCALLASGLRGLLERLAGRVAVLFLRQAREPLHLGVELGEVAFAERARRLCP